MGIFVKETDFVGLDKVAKDKFTVSELEIYIKQFEQEYLIDVLGCDLYAKFEKDFLIEGTKPTEGRFVKIWERLCVSLAGNQVRSRGIKQMLVGFIYWEYLRNSKVKNNISGPTQNDQVNSQSASFNSTNIYQEFNLSARDASAIQCYIYYNPDNYDYSEFEGITIHPTSPI